jgi:hypothetical protein
MMIEADKQVVEYQNKVKKSQQKINKKGNKCTILKEIARYSKPKNKVVLAFILAMIFACAEAIFGFLVVNNVFALNDLSNSLLVKTSRMWSVIIFGVAIIAFFSLWGSKSFFGILGEKITLNLR